ncbi:MAG: META domain-containing protein [Chloroflexia bacterium]
MLNFLRFVTALTMVALTSTMFGSAGAMAAPAGYPAAQTTLPADVLQYEWVLEYFNTDAKSAGQDVSSSRITIKFEADGNLSGSGGCNDYFGSYIVSGQNMTISNNLGSTQKACAGPVMANEQLYFRLLLTVNAYVLNQGKLDLVYADGHNAMTFTAGAARGGQGGKAALPAEVVQTEWILRYFNSSLKADTDVAGVGLSIKFEADGTLSGFSGCNNYSGSYTVSGQQLTIGKDLITTRMACTAALSTLESRYLRLLPTVKSYSATASRLQLVYGDNGAAMVYIPRANAPQVEPPFPTGMPRTGEGTLSLMLLLLAGSFVALCSGFAMRKDRAGGSGQ